MGVLPVSKKESKPKDNSYKSYAHKVAGQDQKKIQAVVPKCDSLIEL